MTAATPLVGPPTAPFDLSQPRRIHVIGVGGPGMSALALALAQMGHNVSGVDLREKQVLDRLRAEGVVINIGHRREQVVGCDAVTYSTAIPLDLNELDEARQLGIPTLHRAAMLASVCAQAKSLGVAGAHGKTTTASMLMLILAAAGLRPSFVIGGDVNDMGTGAQWTGGEWLVVEADESDRTHLSLPLAGTILTNIDNDTLDAYSSLDDIVAGFEQYLQQIPGPKVVGVDDELTAAVAKHHQVISYGITESAAVRAVNIESAAGHISFDVIADGDLLTAVRLPMRGLHNVKNATGAIAMARAIGVDPQVAAAAVSRFGGVARRFEIRGEHNGATFVDDYAHLPAEIDAALRSARDSDDNWNRIIGVFQPNRYNRMAVMSDEYGGAFSAADLIVITDIFSSGTQPIPGVTGKLVVNAILDQNPRSQVVWLPKREDLINFLARQVGPGDVCISMGCGDVAALPDEVLTVRRGRST